MIMLGCHQMKIRNLRRWRCNNLQIPSIYIYLNLGTLGTLLNKGLGKKDNHKNLLVNFSNEKPLAVPCPNGHHSA